MSCSRLERLLFILRLATAVTNATLCSLLTTVLTLSDTITGMDVLAVEMSLESEASYSVMYGITVLLISSSERAYHRDTVRSKPMFHLRYANTMEFRH
jgi:hypothetical protein